MTASADKVQFLLQNSLQQTLPLLKKGIFNQQQLRQIMLERQKHQNKLYSSTFKLSHFLKAIQFQYDLQRKRIYKIKNQQLQNVNPLFKKQSKTDFSIIKRILKLWDRTMHKYRYRTYLWKKYLSFCIAINSKKHFYKALTNSLRFLPFELQLWKIGIRYQIQIGKNKWKARKLFHKGLKLVPAGQKNIQLTKQLIKFELQFVQSLQMREKIIKGQAQQGQNDMKFIMGDNNEQKYSNQDQSQQNQGNLLGINQTSQLLNLKQYHQILFLAINDSIQKNYKSKTYFRNNLNENAQFRCNKLCNIYIDFLNQLQKRQQNQLIVHILNQTIRKIKNYKQQLSKVKLQQNLDEQVQEMQIEVEQQVIQDKKNLFQIQEELIDNKNEQQKTLSKQQEYYNEIIQKYNNSKKLDDKLFVKVVKQFCLKPIKLSTFLQPMINIFFSQTVKILSKNQWLRIPLKNLKLILSMLNKNLQLLNQFPENNYLIKQIKKINSRQFIENIQVLRQIIRFYTNLNKIQENNIIFRSILVNCKSNVQFVQRVKSLFTQ